MSVTQWLTVAAFAIALGLFGVLQVRARQEESRIPTLGDVCAAVMGYRVGPLPVGRIAMFGFWWWLGWHFFAR